MGLTEISDDGGVRTRRVEATVDGELIPGLLWTPSEVTVNSPLVLLGHGRSMDKSMWQKDLAPRFVARGWNALAIDAPGHGERRPTDATGWLRPDVDEAEAGWHAAVNVVNVEAGIGVDRLAYWGFSMGASLGISLISGDARFEAAVLGLMHADWPVPPGTRIRIDAAALTLPVLFVMNWDDTRAPREGALELFDLFASTDKRLLAYPGEHGQLPQEAFDISEDFLTRHIG
ncbi:MAG TPA: alpha/beta fold hydrolase [Humibacter sp.]|jgi:pimeloyl-ACP methyl ester carboxylesterase|nr:alpha/beta fold hydrolase [Humibacter sp.]